MKVLAIGGSNSHTSINRQLANYAASLIPNAEVSSYDLSQYDLPLFSVQLEAESGIPNLAVAFAKQVDEADLLVVSLAEHNGSYSAGFKNLIDWTSRIPNRKTWNDKPMLLMATSPGGRGGQTVLAGAKIYFPFMGADIKGTFSLPKFYDHFKDDGISDPPLRDELMALITTLQK